MADFPAVTPADSPSDPSGFDAVTPHGRGPAPYDIAAPQAIDGIAAAFDAANALAGAGVLYSRGPRQDETEALLTSPQGAGEMSVVSGFPDYESTDVNPGANMENPIQSQGPSSGPYPGTVQGDLPVFDDGLGAGVTGVPPETGNMGPGGMDYPGTGTH
jgi:hypothetical protein